MTNPLREIALLFFKLGCIAFGGPAAHIGMMDDEAVTRRQWLTREHFLDLVGATNLIPGPNSTEMTMHIGYERGGWRGLLLAGSMFILPAATITLILAWLYTTYGSLPQVQTLLWGIKPAVLAIILAAVWKLGRKAVKNWGLAVLGALVLAAVLLGADEVLVLLIGGFLGMLVWGLVRRWRGLPQSGRYLVRQRLRPGRLPARGSGRAIELANPGTVAGCHRHRPVYAGPGVDHGDFCGFSGCRPARWDHRHHRHLFALLHICPDPQSAHPQNA
jgi:chromate transport protein ChrA